MNITSQRWFRCRMWLWSCCLCAATTVGVECVNGFEDQPDKKGSETHPKVVMKEVAIPAKADIELSVEQLPANLKLDLGKQLTSSSVLRWVRLTNRTRRELRVSSATTNCGCVVGYIPQAVMRAEESMMFNVNLTLPPEREAVVRQVTIVVGESPEDVIKIDIAAIAMPVVSIEPPVLTLRDSLEDANFSIVANFEGVPLEGARVKIDGDGFFHSQEHDLPAGQNIFLATLKAKDQGRPKFSGFERFQLILANGQSMPLDLRVERTLDLRLSPSEVNARLDENGKRFFQFMLVGDREDVNSDKLSLHLQNPEDPLSNTQSPPMKLVKTTKKFWLIEVSLEGFSFPKNTTSATFELRTGDRKLGEIVVVDE